MAMPSVSRWIGAALALSAAAQLAACGGSTSSSGTPSQGIEDDLTTGMSNLQTALTSKATDDMVTSATAFDAAAGKALADPAATEGQKNRAWFFGAVARLALLASPYSSGAWPPGMTRFGDVLDAYGMGGSRSQRSLIDSTRAKAWFTDCTSGTCALKTFPAGSPSSAALQGFLAGRLADELQEVANRMGRVTETFQASVTHNGTRVWFDYTDARFLKGVAEAAIAAIRIQEAYRLDVDPVATQAAWPFTFEQLRAANPTLLTLGTGTSLAIARAKARSAVQSFKEAIAALRLETGDQADHFIKISETTCTWVPYVYTCTTTYNPPAKLTEIEDYLNGVAAALAATGTYNFSVRSTTATFVPDAFFGGVSIRPLLPTTVQYGAPMPDPTLGGILVSPVLNTWPLARFPVPRPF